jgi:DNA polymerase III delta prime subunit
MMLGDKKIIFHENIVNSIERYSSKQAILNTIFYGPPGSGKNYLINEFILKLTENMTHNNIDRLKCKKIFDENLNITYYSNEIFILIDGFDWKTSKITLGKFIEEITRTNNVSTNHTKYIYIKYLDVLSDHHQSLRQLLEESFTNTRFIFSCRSKDKIDTALLSRCINIRVPAPSVEKLVSWQEKSVKYTHLNDLHEIIKNANRNANTLSHMIIDYNVNNNVVENANVLIAKNIFKVLNTQESLSRIQELSEQIFKSSVPLSTILKCYIQIIPSHTVKKSVHVIQSFFTNKSNIIFDMNQLLFELTFILKSE